MIDRLPLAARLLLLELVKLTAPLVCIVYRDGWFNTPDDPASPHGQYEPKMQGILRRWGPRVSDWWWLGVRNRAYGLSYALKPAHFKALTTYSDCDCVRGVKGRTRITVVDDYAERAINFGWFHLLVGYRVTPIFNEWMENNLRGLRGEPLIPFRPINMDARPILSLRTGRAD
jgi:hypothetical protein